MNIDVVCFKNGCHGDTSVMVLLDDPDGAKIHPDIASLSKVTRESMFLGISQCKPGAQFSKIGEAIEEYANEHGYHVNKEFGGHGIAHHLHMPPLVHHQKSNQSR